MVVVPTGHRNQVIAAITVVVPTTKVIVRFHSGPLGMRYEYLQAGPI